MAAAAAADAEEIKAVDPADDEVTNEDDLMAATEDVDVLPPQLPRITSGPTSAAVEQWKPDDDIDAKSWDAS